MPVLAGRGGISNYINPLLRHFCRRRDREIDVVFHWRVRGRERSRRAEDLLQAGIGAEFPDVRHVRTHLPDRLLRAAWRLPVPPLCSLSLPPTDVYFATTPMLPAAAAFKRITVVHDVTPAMIPEFFPQPRERYVARVTRHCGACHVILAVSRTTADNLAAVCGIPRERIRVAYPGLPHVPEPTVSDTEILARFGIRKPFAVYLGALAHNKNIDGLLRAFGAFRRRGFEDWQLVVAGKDFVGGGHWDAIVGQEGMANAVRFTGWVDDERWAFLRQAAVLLHLSWYEGFPVPVMEALSLGLPVLVSDRGPFPEAVPNREQVVDPADPEAVAERLAAFASHPETQRSWREFMLRRARDFSWDRTADILEEAVRTACEA